MTTAPSTTAPAAPPAADLVTLTIDDVEVSVPKGTLIIRAAEQAGIEIPRFCDHPGLDPVGACRQCLVEVWMPGRPGPDGTPGEPTQMQGPPGRMKPQASCTMAVAPGMVVKTQYTSPGADKAQKGVMELLLINHPLDCPVCDKGGECPLQNQAMSNGRSTSRFEDVKRTYPKPINISSQVLLDRERCVLCARCTRFSEQVAGDPFIALVERGALQQVGIYEEKPFESYFSGNTVQICPVGALTGAAYRFRSRPFDLVSTPSACEHCASGCAIRTDHRRGTVLRRMAWNDPEVNEEWNCDKGRWAFAYTSVGDRLQLPMVRGDDGELRVASWREALRGRRCRPACRVVERGARRRPGQHRGRLRLRQVRPHGARHQRRRLPRPAALGRGGRLPRLDRRGHRPRGGAVTYADLESAGTVLLVGLEPEDESPIVFLRLRKAFRRHGTAVYAVAPVATRGLAKLGGTLIPTAPGTEPEVLQALAEGSGTDLVVAAGQALRDGAVVLVGERLATVPGALSAAVALAEATGARLAWVPRRAGERGALEAGAFPTLLPGGRPLSDAGARADVASAWGVQSVADAPGRDTAGILAAAASGELDALVVGGVDPDDLGIAGAAEALARPFVVSLELRSSAVTAVADVVLPVAAHAEKGGSFVNWEGRVRGFDVALETGYVSDYRALDMLADEMGEFLGTRTLREIRSEMEALGPWQGARPAAPSVEAGDVPTVEEGTLVLATWRHLLDRGSLQDGEPFLAGTAPAPVARISAGTAQGLGVTDGDALTVRVGDTTVTAPVLVCEMADHVVWLPTNSVGSDLRAALAGAPGALVSVTKEGPA